MSTGPLGTATSRREPHEASSHSSRSTAHFHPSIAVCVATSQPNQLVDDRLMHTHRSTVRGESTCIDASEFQAPLVVRTTISGHDRNPYSYSLREISTISSRGRDSIRLSRVTAAHSVNPLFDSSALTKSGFRSWPDPERTNVGAYSTLSAASMTIQASLMPSDARATDDERQNSRRPRDEQHDDGEPDDRNEKRGTDQRVKSGGNDNDSQSQE